MITIKRILRTLYNSKKNLVYQHQGPVQEWPVPEGFFSVTLDESLVDKYFGAPVDQTRGRRYKTFLEGAQVGTLIHDGSSWASVGWVSTPTSSPPPHVPKRLARGSYWLHDQHTAERFRGRGLQKASVSLRLDHIYTDAGPDARILTDVASKNTPSRKSQVANGFVPAGQATLRSAGPPRIFRARWGSWNQKAEHPPIGGFLN